MLQRLGRGWEAMKDIGAVLWPMRFSVAIVLIAIPFLFFLPPSQDALLAVASDAADKPWAAVLFAAASFFWAFATFYWARFMSRLDTQRGPRLYPPLITEQWLELLNEALPRWLGVAALATIAAATWWANRYGAAVARILGAAIAMGVLYYLFAWRRRAVMNLLLKPGIAASMRLDPTFQRDLDALAGYEEVPRLTKGVALLVIGLTVALYWLCGGLEDQLRRGIAAALGVSWLASALLYLWTSRGWLPRDTKLTVGASAVLLFAVFVFSIYSATWLPGVLSPPFVILSVAAAWVFTGTFLIALPTQRFGAPVLPIVIVVAALLSFFSRDNHDVRLRAEGAAPNALPLDRAFEDWYSQAAKAWGNDRGPVPLVIVATAGGASRAGYWTTRVLGEIEDQHPDFHKYVFAISSVSGGSLGAAVWRTMLQDGGARCPAGKLADCGKEFFAHDFLAPVFLTGLYADLAQRLLPGRLLPDRATALEQSWEVAWREVTGGSVSFQQAFHQARPKPDEWRPLLLLNGTSEKSGRRIITSELAVSSDCFPDAIDFFAMTGADVNLSTAIHNSARFPYIDAAGTIWTAVKKETEPKEGAPPAGPPGKCNPSEPATHGASSESIVSDRIVDGGYFENFGAATAIDLLESLTEISDVQRRRFVPIIVQISSDPALLQQPMRDAQSAERLDFPLRIASDATAPLITFFDTRDALGYRATRVVARRLEGRRAGSAEPSPPVGHYLHFRLTNPYLPMSWMMSSWTLDRFDQEWGSNCDRLAALERLLWPGTKRDCNRVAGTTP